MRSNIPYNLKVTILGRSNFTWFSPNKPQSMSQTGNNGSDSICTMPPTNFTLLGFGGASLVAATFLLCTMADTNFIHSAFWVLCGAFYPAAMFHLCTIPQADCFLFVFLMHPLWLHPSIVISQGRARASPFPCNWNRNQKPWGNGSIHQACVKSRVWVNLVTAYYQHARASNKIRSTNIICNLQILLTYTLTPLFSRTSIRDQGIVSTDYRVVSVLECFLGVIMLSKTAHRRHLNWSAHNYPRTRHCT